MRVRWSARALDDRLAAFAYLVERTPASALAIDEAIVATANRLTEMPTRNRSGRMADTRETLVAGTPYFLVYRIDERGVRILRVLHGARNWPPQGR